MYITIDRIMVTLVSLGQKTDKKITPEIEVRINMIMTHCLAAIVNFTCCMELQ